MSPRAVLDVLLPWIYGKQVRHDDVLTGVLGGAGRDPAGSDTTVSRNTTAHFRLRSIGDTSCLMEASWKHEFSGVRNNHHLVVFATCDRAVLDLVMSERTYPLFEVWFLENEDRLDDFFPTLRETLKVGVTYLDSDGGLHIVEPAVQRGTEVALRDYDRFVRLHDGIDRRNVRIIHLDLYDLVDPDLVVESIESLSMTASTVAPFDIGFFTWSPPHPCFMREVTFDLSEMPRSGEKLTYLVVPSTLRSGSVSLDGRWMDIPDHLVVPISSWMLPGHGVTLLWRPVNEVEPQHDTGGQQDAGGPRPSGRDR